MVSLVRSRTLSITVKCEQNAVTFGGHNCGRMKFENFRILYFRRKWANFRFACTFAEWFIITYFSSRSNFCSHSIYASLVLNPLNTVKNLNVCPVFYSGVPKSSHRFNNSSSFLRAILMIRFFNTWKNWNHNCKLIILHLIQQFTSFSGVWENLIVGTLK